MVFLMTMIATVSEESVCLRVGRWHGYQQLMGGSREEGYGMVVRMHEVEGRANGMGINRKEEALGEGTSSSHERSGDEWAVLFLEMNGQYSSWR